MRRPIAVIFKIFYLTNIGALSINIVIDLTKMCALSVRSGAEKTCLTLSDLGVGGINARGVSAGTRFDYASYITSKNEPNMSRILILA